MVPKVKEQIKEGSLLSTGTWDFRKISGEDPGGICSGHRWM